MALWIVALVAGAAPRRMWPRLEPPLPLFATAVPAAILTIIAGFAIAVPGFLTFAADAADRNNSWVLQQLVRPGPILDVAIVPDGVSALTLFIFIFLTPAGLFALYLVCSGTVRAISAYLDPDDARGDFMLSGIHWVATRILRKSGEEMRRVARELREGPETADRLFTGEWAGIDADYVLLASRRKAEWNAGAIIMTSADWYRLGVPFDIETPNGLRIAYPLKRMEAAEVVRRGILYELPPLTTSRDQKF